MEQHANESLLFNVGEVEIVYKKKVKAKISDRPQINTSKDAYEVLRHYWNEGKMDLFEEFKVLLLNRSNRVLHLFEVSSGGMTATIADPRLILVCALKTAAVSIILAHNHPSTNTKPSRADEELTQKIKQACAYFDIKVLDHIILSSEGYFSFADEGLI